MCSHRRSCCSACGVTSALGDDGAVNSIFSAFKTDVSSDPAQAGSIPVRLREEDRLPRHMAPNAALIVARGEVRVLLVPLPAPAQDRDAEEQPLPRYRSAAPGPPPGRPGA